MSPCRTASTSGQDAEIIVVDPEPGEKWRWEAPRCVGFRLRRPSSGRLRPTEAGRATPSLRPHSATEDATLSL